MRKGEHLRDIRWYILSYDDNDIPPDTSLNYACISHGHTVCFIWKYRSEGCCLWCLCVFLHMVENTEAHILLTSSGPVSTGGRKLLCFNSYICIWLMFVLLLVHKFLTLHLQFFDASLRLEGLLFRIISEFLVNLRCQ